MDNNTPELTPEELKKLENMDLSNLPSLRFRLKCLTGDLVQIGSAVLENITLDALVFLRLPEGGTKEDLIRAADNRTGIEKYKLDKQFVVYLDSKVEVLELEPIKEPS